MVFRRVSLQWSKCFKHLLLGDDFSTISRWLNFALIVCPYWCCVYFWSFILFNNWKFQLRFCTLHCFEVSLLKLRYLVSSNVASLLAPVCLSEMNFGRTCRYCQSFSILPFCTANYTFLITSFAPAISLLYTVWDKLTCSKQTNCCYYIIILLIIWNNLIDPTNSSTIIMGRSIDIYGRYYISSCAEIWNFSLSVEKYFTSPRSKQVQLFLTFRISKRPCNLFIL